MATIDRTEIAKSSPIVEDEQGQLRARQGISREVVSELSKIKGEPDWMAEKRLRWELRHQDLSLPPRRQCTHPGLGYAHINPQALRPGDPE